MMGSCLEVLFSNSFPFIFQFLQARDAGLYEVGGKIMKFRCYLIKIFFSASVSSFNGT
jgi:hypothetical protein